MLTAGETFHDLHENILQGYYFVSGDDNDDNAINQT